MISSEPPRRYTTPERYDPPQRLKPPVRLDPRQTLDRQRRPQRRPGRAHHGPLRFWWLGAFAIGGSLATAAVVLVYSAAATNPRQSATVADPVLGGGPGCEATRSEQLVRGNGIGSTTTGPEVILAFQHAYYVERSGEAARAVTTPDASVPRVEVIDAGIASIPPDSRHCVLIVPMNDGRFDVVITESRPNATVRTYRQIVSVADRDGAVIITKIAPPG
ncbi:hypothetical protein ACFQZZ_02165 [Nocardia sp. GCM10030253]|uniref:hypothetical protein n=1 Tax=Nocardia sp. GCM10030253 TaxID=3273404 RepID=UPI003627CED0